MVSRNIILAALVIVVATVLPMTDGFVARSTISTATSRATPAYMFGKGKKQQEDFSDMEVRDLTREEMLDINKQNEEIMNMELGMMVSRSNIFSCCSLPKPGCSFVST
jgi:hypothetical protein